VRLLAAFPSKADTALLERTLTGFPSKPQVYIDDNGDAEGNFSVVAVLPERSEKSSENPENRTRATSPPSDPPSTPPLVPDRDEVGEGAAPNTSEAEAPPAALSMQPVGYFRSRDSNSSSLPVFHYYDSKRPINWVGGAPPKAEPDCGFRGERCATGPQGPGGPPKLGWSISLLIAVVVVVIFMLAGGAFK